jgi:NADH-quinone oxidoreductase subunit A
MSDLVLLILIFLAAGMTVLASNLLLGRLVRPNKPSPEKGEVYECGEQPIGSAWIQFDVRFYVVALLFVIFDVELAFFFPWAVVFGSACRASDESLDDGARIQAEMVIQPQTEVDWNAGRKMTDAELEAAKTSSASHHLPPPDPQTMRKFAWISFLDILVFFGVLLVGFAYLWRRGDLKWVRSAAALTVSGGRKSPD